ncbi:hypothetical protein EXIGLDRAFT_831461 [Exidia glandulosa HHB12029]|uniref:Uncharacterized protein n=1 Tax=Exidia glandulosa HHB12029 TaxID=1314781 RepID=A0A165MND9_EXIGL|nr:hypothetical protein EXIGLDRAFT_831461 [Exidia glandulosa HHB12029]
MSPPANSSLSSPQPAVLVWTKLGDAVQLPSALREQCLSPYTRNVAPTLHGLPIVVEEESSSNVDDAIVLAPGLTDLALRTVKAEFAKGRDADSTTLRATVLCTPVLDSPLAVDAAVRYIAHDLKADILILDVEDLAAGERGSLGADFTNALWSIYSRHYELREEENALRPLKYELERAEELLSSWTDTLKVRQEELSRYREAIGVV